MKANSSTMFTNFISREIVTVEKNVRVGGVTQW